LLTTQAKPQELSLLTVEFLEHPLARGDLLTLLGQLVRDMALVLLELRVHTRPIHLYQP
jgi:hypothetical protein